MLVSPSRSASCWAAWMPLALRSMEVMREWGKVCAKKQESRPQSQPTSRMVAPKASGCWVTHWQVWQSRSQSWAAERMRLAWGCWFFLS